MEPVNMRSDPVTRSSPALATADAFRAIAELGGDIAFIIDCATRAPVYVSPGLDALMGYGVADFHTQLTKGGDGPLAALCAGLDERVRRFASGDGSRLRVVREFDLIRPDGQSVAVEIISTLLEGEAARPRLLAGLVRDLSAQRAREREQKRFASMLNHEFRTPLSTIDGAIQRLPCWTTICRRNAWPSSGANGRPTASRRGCCWTNWWRRRAPRDARSSLPQSHCRRRYVAIRRVCAWP
jgi:signal transduction histidine kinase